MKSYTYVMADIHGEYDIFIKMLEKIKFSEDDTMYIIGDVVDRGPNPIKTLLHIIDNKNIHLLCGNHELTATMCLNFLLKDITEEMVANINEEMLGLLAEWKINGGGSTMNELFECDKDTRNKVFNYLLTLKTYKELEVNGQKFLLVHAGLDNFEKDKKLKDYNILDLTSCRMDFKKQYFEDKYLVVGHTPTQAIKGNENPGYIYYNNNNIDIDCGATFGGRLACLRLDDMKEFYVESPKAKKHKK